MDDKQITPDITAKDEDYSQVDLQAEPTPNDPPIVQSVNPEPELPQDSEIPETSVPETAVEQSEVPAEETIIEPSPAITTPPNLDPDTTLAAPENEPIMESPSVPSIPIEPKVEPQTTEPEITNPLKVPSETPKVLNPANENLDAAPPPPTPTPPIDGVPIAVANLTDEELKFAAALYAKRNQRSLSLAGVKARQQTAARNLGAITKYLNKHSPTTNASIARALNLPPRRVQHYMQILTTNGTVTATGWARSRKYTKN